jgi:NAD(P)-dependent dehydrogenase (short-subunit alcohol dehydrogenase family)
MSDPIRDRVALVTGAARGIGRAIAAALLDAGGRVALCDIDEQAVLRTAAEMAPRPAHGFGLDVTDRAAFEGVVARVERELGPVDVLVNNAGIMPLGPFLDQPETADRRQMDINVWGVTHGMRVVLPRMIGRKRGHVVNIASCAGKASAPFASMYSATKHAVVGLTEGVRYELRATGVSFTYVMPSLVDTELIDGAHRLRWPPLVRPEDVANATVNAILRGKVDVFVPRAARLSAILPAVLPRRFYEGIGRALGVDRVFENIDVEARSAYDRRALGERATRLSGGDSAR